MTWRLEAVLSERCRELQVHPDLVAGRGHVHWCPSEINIAFLHVALERVRVSVVIQPARGHSRRGIRSCKGVAADEQGGEEPEQHCEHRHHQCARRLALAETDGQEDEDREGDTGIPPQGVDAGGRGHG